MNCPRCHVQIDNETERCPRCGIFSPIPRIHPVVEDDGCTMYWLVWDDEKFNLGELWQVEHLRNRLDALIGQGTHDGQIDENDERIAVWVTPDEAADLPGVNIGSQMIRRACQKGLIKGVKPDPWRFTPGAFWVWRHSEAVRRRGHKGSTKS